MGRSLPEVESREGEAVEDSLPLEPLRSLAVAAEMIPMRSMNSLYQFLLRHKAEFPSRYFHGKQGKQVRMLYDNEIKKIREMLLIENGDDKYHTGVARGPRAARSPIGAIMQRAMAR